MLAPAANGYVAVFGDGRANVYALDATMGKVQWKVRVEDHPASFVTGGIKIHRDRVYVPVASGEERLAFDSQYEYCTFRGSVVALELATGRQVWKAYIIPEKPHRTQINRHGAQQYGPAGAGIWSSPTVDTKKNVLYVGTGNSSSDPPAPQSEALVALSLDDGRMFWWKQLAVRSQNAADVEYQPFAVPTRRGGGVVAACYSWFVIAK
jgi:polyvinyl alcohol dehydrogenase (cytochrome)